MSGENSIVSCYWIGMTVFGEVWYQLMGLDNFLWVGFWEWGHQIGSGTWANSTWNRITHHNACHSVHAFHLMADSIQKMLFIGLCIVEIWGEDMSLGLEEKVCWMEGNIEPFYHRKQFFVVINENSTHLILAWLLLQKESIPSHQTPIR